MLQNKGNRSTIKTILFVLLGFQSILNILLADLGAQACGPGRAGGRRFGNRLRKYPPLVQRQYIPNVSENTFGASGAPEGPIKRHDKRFKELIQNWNPDIEFRDDERTGADRMMSQRLKEKLSVLAISVMNQWPNVRLRVIEGWDEDRRHSANSLHYEGRAVDITTSDKDRSKYGMLARLAVEAGFDWVHYESRSHVHCSVKSEKADSIRNNGCFDAESLVETPLGQMEMSQLQTNDLVLTMNSQTGELQFSPVLMWLDRDEFNSELYVNLTTKSGKQIRLTSSHLIYLADEPMPASALVDATTTTTTTTTTDSVNGDLNKDNKRITEQTNDQSNGGNNYYYDVHMALAERNLTISRPSYGGELAGESVPSLGFYSQIVAPASTTTTNSSGVYSEPSPPNQHQEADQLSDYVYTTYARNAVVGQYLLTHNPDEQVTFDRSIVSDGEYGPSERRSSVSRLIFTSIQDNELNTRKTYASSDFKSKKNKKYKHSQPQTRTKAKVVLDEIVSVKYVSKHGIYAPLTRDGNIVVNSVVASCYAVISDHDMAHWSMAPVRWLSSLNDKLFGLRPETPTHERTVDFIKRRKLYEQTQQIEDISNQRSADDQHDGMKHVPDYNTTNSLNRTTATRASRHVHWYPILLYNIARYVLPNNYLY